jgi:putative SOS response-associated peptidase YedK
LEPGSSTLAAIGVRRRGAAHADVPAELTLIVCRTASRELASVGRMCGRYTSVKSDDQIAKELKAIDKMEGAPAKQGYNIAPTNTVRIVVNRSLRDPAGKKSGDAVRQLRTAKWGLVPSWSKDAKGGARMINARSDSVATKPSYRAAYKSRRCLVPADGWYEWKVIDAPGGPVKVPHYMTPQDGHLLTFAGLYEFWSDPTDKDAPTLTTCTIITTDSLGYLADIHNRQPLLLPNTAWERWLDPTVADPSDLLGGWDEAIGEHLELRPVSTQVNKVANDGPDLIAPLPAERAGVPDTLF